MSRGPSRSSPAIISPRGYLPIWETAARLRPDWSFVLIGYAYDGESEKVHARIRELPNMYFLGAKSYQELPKYLANFDVATIPFVLNSITHGCSPVKLFEYMAAGKPIVCTPMREILKYESIHFAASPADFVREIESAVAGKDDPAGQALLAREAKENTWRSRAEKLKSALQRKR